MQNSVVDKKVLSSILKPRGNCNNYREAINPALGIFVGVAGAYAESRERRDDAGSGGEKRRKIAEVLRLLGAGAPVAILLALGEGPLRTKGLTAAIPSYTPRTVYRHLAALVKLGLIEREEEGSDLRPKVILRLSDGPGRDLYELTEKFAASSQTQLSKRQVEPQAWASLALLADLWEGGVLQELSHGPRSPTELARKVSGLSYHQLSRKTGAVNTAGFLHEAAHAAGQRRCYALTDAARRAMGLIAGIGRWCDRYSTDRDEEGMAVAEVGSLLRAMLPLVRLPQHRGKRLALYVVQDDEVEELVVEVGDDGGVRLIPGDAGATGWAEGDAGAWCAALLEGRFAGFTGNDEELVEDSVRTLHAALWTPASS